MFPVHILEEDEDDHEDLEDMASSAVASDLDIGCQNPSGLHLLIHEYPGSNYNSGICRCILKNEWCKKG